MDYSKLFITDKMVPVFYRFTDGALLDISKYYRIDNSGKMYRLWVPNTLKQRDLFVSKFGQKLIDTIRSKLGLRTPVNVLEDYYYKYGVNEFMTTGNFYMMLKGNIPVPYLSEVTNRVQVGEYEAIAVTTSNIKSRIMTTRAMYCSFIGIPKEDAHKVVAFKDNSKYNIDINNLYLKQHGHGIKQRGPRDKDRYDTYDWMKYAQTT